MTFAAHLELSCLSVWPPFALMLLLQQAEPVSYLDGSDWREASPMASAASGRVRVRVTGKRVPTFFEAETGADVLVQAEQLPHNVLPIRALWPETGLWLVRSTDSTETALRLAARLSRTPGVQWAAPDYFVQHTASAFGIPPNDPRYSGQWYLQRLGIEDAWRVTSGDPSVSVAVIDNGCDSQHPDLRANLRQGRDVIDSDDDPSPNATTRAANHGTACAGLIAAEGDNRIGISGVCPRCTVRCIRLLADRDELVPISADVDAFRAALTLDVAVVSNSWGYRNPMPVPAALQMAIREVASQGRGGKGALVFFAAGNDNRLLQPGELYDLPEVITIGALNSFDELAPFSNKGAALDVVAPTGTLTTDLGGAAGEDPGDYTSLFGGTSAACPVAAGVAALMVSRWPHAGRAELQARLIQTARPAPFAQPDDAGHDLGHGFGIISAKAALSDTSADGGSTDGGTETTVTASRETLGPLAPGCSIGVSLSSFALFMALGRYRRSREATARLT